MTRLAPSGMETALMMLPGGWPETVITLRSCTAGTARSGVPGTEKELGRGLRLLDRVGGEEAGADEEDQDQAARCRARSWRPAWRSPPGAAGAAAPRHRRRRSHATSPRGRSVQVIARRAYVPPDHPKWSMGPCPAPSRQSAPPARPRATKALAARTASSTPSPRARLRRDGGRQRAPGAVVVAGRPRGRPRAR